jgi:hypothetical protein
LAFTEGREGVVEVSGGDSGVTYGRAPGGKRGEGTVGDLTKAVGGFYRCESF